MKRVIDNSIHEHRVAPEKYRFRRIDAFDESKGTTPSYVQHMYAGINLDT